MSSRQKRLAAFYSQRGASLSPIYDRAVERLFCSVVKDLAKPSRACSFLSEKPATSGFHSFRELSQIVTPLALHVFAMFDRLKYSLDTKNSWIPACAGMTVRQWHP
jgi:hypothetical protein